MYACNKGKHGALISVRALLEAKSLLENVHLQTFLYMLDPVAKINKVIAICANKNNRFVNNYIILSFEHLNISGCNCRLDVRRQDCLKISRIRYSYCPTKYIFPIIQSDAWKSLCMFMQPPFLT